MFTQGSRGKSASRNVKEDSHAGGKSDHITSPGVTTARVESQVGPVQRRREQRDVMGN